MKKKFKYCRSLFMQCCENATVTTYMNLLRFRNIALLCLKSILFFLLFVTIDFMSVLLVISHIFSSKCNNQT